jgi:pentatricopeptide repeat protein
MEAAMPAGGLMGKGAGNRGRILATRDEVMEPTFRVGNWLVSPRLNRVEGNGRAVRLEPKVMQVLVCLVERPGEVFAKEELLRKVWADTFVTDEVLTRAVSELRRVFGDDAKQPRVIETVQRGGYRLIAPVKPEVPATAGASRWSRRPLLFAIAALIIAIAAALAALSVAGLRGRVTQQKRPPIRSLAVLPLQNLSHDPGQEYFADGMTEELIADLGKISALRVISRTSIMQYKGGGKTLPQIARELNVDAVVEGSVLRSENRVRITAQLIRAASDQHLWGESYERDLDDIFALQRDVAHAITREVQINISKEDETRLSQHHDVTPAAHEAYLKGRSEWDKRNSGGLKEALLKSIEYFEKAIREDPDYALAYAGMADSYIVLADTGSLPPEQAYAKVRWASAKAVDADENLADAHIMLASVKEKDWDWTAAEREYQRAIALNPGLSRAHHWYALLLSATSRHANAISEINRAIELEPLSTSLYGSEVLLYCQAHRYDDAIQALKEMQQRGSSADEVHFFLAKIYLYEGRYDRALDEIRAVREKASSEYIAPLLANVFARVGRKSEALQVVLKLERESAQSPVDPVLVAMAWAGLSDDKTMLWLRKGFDAHSPKIMSIAVTPEFAPLHSDPRFTDLVRRVGLPVPRA